MKDRSIEITNDYVLMDDGTYVMHSWEDTIMRKKAEWVCSNGGNIIEFGFGLGISANYIQSHNIESHTICEIHPDILRNLKQWSVDKKNIIILEGDWVDNISEMGIYDGILFDTHLDFNLKYFFREILQKISKKGTKVTWWNNHGFGNLNRRPTTTEFEIIDVNPPPNDYFNLSQYFLPKCTI